MVGGGVFRVMAVSRPVPKSDLGGMRKSHRMGMEGRDFLPRPGWVTCV